MACLKISTNIPRNEIPKDFTAKIIRVLKSVLNETPQNVACFIIPDCMLSFGENIYEPGIIATIECQGNLGPVENKIISRQLSNWLSYILGVNHNRIIFTFYDIQNYNIAINGDTLPFVLKWM